MNEIILYNYFRSSTSYRVRIALHWKKIPFDYAPVHLLNNGGEQHAENYLKLNPMAEVPTLIHRMGASGERIIAQSLPIMEYLDEVFHQQGPVILPRDPYHRALVRQFCENINSFIHPLSNLKVMQYLEKKNNYSQADKDSWAQNWGYKGLQALEDMIKHFGGKYAIGDEISMADMCLAPQIFSAHRFKLDLSRFPRVANLEDVYTGISAFKLAHPLRQVDTPEKERIG